MARITEIRSTSRPIRVKNRTALEYSQNEKYFSIWVQSAGQEGESSLYPLDIQFDREMAAQLCSRLHSFLSDTKDEAFH